MLTDAIFLLFFFLLAFIAVSGKRDAFFHVGATGAASLPSAVIPETFMTLETAGCVSPRHKTRCPSADWKRSLLTERVRAATAPLLSVISERKK